MGIGFDPTKTSAALQQQSGIGSAQQVAGQHEDVPVVQDPTLGPITEQPAGSPPGAPPELEAPPATGEPDEADLTAITDTFTAALEGEAPALGASDAQAMAQKMIDQLIATLPADSGIDTESLTLQISVILIALFALLRKANMESLSLERKGMQESLKDQLAAGKGAAWKALTSAIIKSVCQITAGVVSLAGAIKAGRTLQSASVKGVGPAAQQAVTAAAANADQILKLSGAISQIIGALGDLGAAIPEYYKAIDETTQKMQETMREMTKMILENNKNFADEIKSAFEKLLQMIENLISSKGQTAKAITERFS